MSESFKVFSNYFFKNIKDFFREKFVNEIKDIKVYLNKEI